MFNPEQQQYSDWWLYYPVTKDQKVGPVHRLHILFTYLLSATTPQYFYEN